MRRNLPIKADRCVQGAKAFRASQATEFQRGLFERSGPVTCRKGCHHCCYNPIAISVLEGITIFQWLQDQRLWTTTLKEKFQEAQSSTLGLSIPVWLLSQIPCPLLDLEEGVCIAYGGRPLTCRITASTGDPYYCHPHRVVDAAGVVPRTDTLERVYAHEKTLLRLIHTHHSIIPLAAAVLLGEKISKGEISIEDYPQQVVIQHLDHG